MNWKAGDVALLVNTFYGIHENHECVITGPFKTTINDERNPAGTVGYLIECCGTEYFVTPDQLRPLPPPNELSTWDECVFKPLEFVT